MGTKNLNEFKIQLLSADEFASNSKLSEINETLEALYVNAEKIINDKYSGIIQREGFESLKNGYILCINKISGNKQYDINQYMFDKLCNDGIDGTKIDCHKFGELNNIGIKLYDHIKQLDKTKLLDILSKYFLNCKSDDKSICTKNMFENYAYKNLPLFG